MHVRDLLERKQHRKPRHIQPRRHAGLQHLPKTYHTACINGCDGYTPPTGDEDEEWECPACHDLKEHEHAKPSKVSRSGARVGNQRKAYARTRMSRGWWTHGTKTTFNPPARMTTHARANTSQTCSDRAHTPQTPAMGEHIWHTLRDAIKFNTSETHPVLTSALGACVVVRNVDLWAPPHPAAVDVRAAPPTVTTRAACVYSSDGNCEGSSQRSGSKASQNVWTRYGRGHNGRAGPKASMVHRGPDRQPAASTPQQKAGARAPRAAHPSIAEVLVEHLGALRKDTAAPDRSLTRAWVRQRASTRPS
jgi:hypothetical protein